MGQIKNIKLHIVTDIKIPSDRHTPVLTMEENEEDMIMDNIDEYLNDECRVVSYKWLSLSFSLDVNKATQVLQNYLDKKNNNENLDVVYFLGGKVTNGTTISFQYKLVKASSLEEAKKSFESVSTCHIYSIQKTCVKDAGVLYSSDVDIVKENLSNLNVCSGIQCSSLKDFDETAEERCKGGVAPPPPPPPVNNSHGFDKKPSDTPTEPTSKPTASVTSSSGGSKDKGKPKKETTSKSFFGKASTTKKASSDTTSKSATASENSVKEETSPKTKTVSSPKTAPAPKATKKGISDAFAKSKPKS